MLLLMLTVRRAAELEESKCVCGRVEWDHLRGSPESGTLNKGALLFQDTPPFPPQTRLSLALGAGEPPTNTYFSFFPSFSGSPGPHADSEILMLLLVLPTPP